MMHAIRGLCFIVSLQATVNAASKERTQPPSILPAGRAFLNSVEVSFLCPTPGGRIHYTTDLSDPTIESPMVPLDSPGFFLHINTSGSHTIKAFALADGMIPSDIVLKRIQVFSQMDPPKLNPLSSGRYDAPLNVTVSLNSAVCSLDYFDISICYDIVKNRIRQAEKCIDCDDNILFDSIGNYNVSAYYSIDGLALSGRSFVQYTLTRPPFDSKKVYSRSSKTFQFKPKVDVFPISKYLSPQKYGCAKRDIRGHHVILHNPLGHFDILPPAAGCGNGLSLPSETSKSFTPGLDPSVVSNTFFKKPSYRKMVETLSREDIAQWRQEYAAALAEGATSCTVTTNAGFFDIMNYKCLGNLVSQGKVIQSSNNHNVNFGIKNGSFVIGYVGLGDSKKSTNIEEFDTLVSGLVWLVRGKRSYVKESISPSQGVGIIGDGENMSIQTNGPNFATILSARTAIGYDSFGRLMIAQVEGESFERGVDLYEFADLLIELGFESAINLDGGGSATITSSNTLISEPSWKCTSDDIFPTDDDVVPLAFHADNSISLRVCEKRVSSIACIHPLAPPEDSLLRPSQRQPTPSAAPSAPPSRAVSTDSGSPSSAPSISSYTDASGTSNTNYTSINVSDLERNLKIYEFCTFTLAILLVISLTGNGWWAVSYNALRLKLVEGEAGIGSRGPSKSQAKAGLKMESGVSREIELRQKEIVRRPPELSYSIDSDDEFDEIIDDNTENDSHDDESALLSPPKVGREGNAMSSKSYYDVENLQRAAVVNPFRRR